MAPRKATKPAKPKARKRSKAKGGEPNKGGRPTKYTPELLEAICKRLRRGDPLAVICRDETIPVDDDTVRAWEKRADVGAHVSDALARAREDGEAWIAAECLQIADTPAPGMTEKLELVKIANPDDPDGEPTTELQVTERKVEDMLGHRKLQIETRLKLLAIFNPRKYGPKVDHNHAGKITLAQLVEESHKP